MKNIVLLTFGCLVVMSIFNIQVLSTPTSQPTPTPTETPTPPRDEW